MHKSEYKNIFQLEESHFYYVATHELIMGLVQKYGRKDDLVLDAGCGTGGLMTKLIAAGINATGIDKSNEAIKYCLKRGLPVKEAGVDNLPFKSESMDGVVCIDVLYHLWVNKAEDAVAEFSRVLKSKGWLIIKAPAHNWIRTEHDKLVMTGRRFSLTEMKGLLQKQGFEVVYASYAHLPLFLMSVAKTFFDKSSGKSGVRQMNPVINRLLLSYFKLENWWLLNVGAIPGGNCIVLVARKVNVDK